MIAHLDISKFISIHLQYLFNLFSCNCNDESLFIINARSFSYAIELIVIFDV